MIENGGNDMALQFILGSARSGKTDFIYDQMIKDSMEHEDEEFFFIVPDQSTLNAQKQLVTRHPRHGTFNIDVVGFFRLTYRVFEELSYIPKDLLEDEGKSMVIRKIMEQHKEELKVFDAAVIAHQKTNKPIYTHTTIGTLGYKQAQYFISKKVDPKRVVIGHMDLSKDLDVIKKVIDLGFFVGFDTIGKNDYFPDDKRIEFLLELEKTNRIHRVVLSEDLTRKSHLSYKGGIGYNYIFTDFIPNLIAAGMKETSIHQMLIDNPECIFAELE